MAELTVEKINKDIDVLLGYSYDLPDDMWKRVITALRLAAKVLGEPTYETLMEGCAAFEPIRGPHTSMYDVYKAMIAQALKEI
jgi:hypothetical protein